MDKSELKQFIEKHYPYLKEATLDLFVVHTNYLKLSKGTKLISTGKRHPYFYFLLSGSVKAYYLKDSKQVCSWFAFENETIGTMRGLEGLPPSETIELLEDSELIQLNTEKITAFAKTNLFVSHLITELITEHALFLEERLYQLQFKSSKERYEDLLAVAPEVLQRISLTDIASYLGISRETLSRIRAQK